jgi:hypothetical protein
LLREDLEWMDGWYRNGKVGICAWERELWQKFNPTYFNDHKLIFEKLELESEQKAENYVVKFTSEKIKAFQLLHVFIHELGHHHDRMTTKRKHNSSRGEDFAEEYANKYFDMIFDRYVQQFKLF